MFAVSRAGRSGSRRSSPSRVMTYFNASIQDWWGSDGFGGRRFDGTIPLFCLGIAAFAALRRRAHPPSSAARRRGGRRAARPVEPDADERGAERPVPDRHAGVVRRDRIGAGARLPPLVRQSVHLSGEPRVRAAQRAAARARTICCRRTGSSAIRCARTAASTSAATTSWLLEDGWHAAEREGPVTFRWAASPATVLIPLDHAAPLTVQVRLQAFTYPGATPQTIALTVNGRTFGPVPVPDRWETLEFATGIDALARKGQPRAARFRARAHAGRGGTRAATRARSPPPWTTFACRSADARCRVSGFGVSGLGSGYRPETNDQSPKDQQRRP